MFERLSQSVGSFFSMHDAHDDYLASSSDLADLERRMRQVETEDHDYSMHFCGSLGRHYDAQ
ncbi:MULTISPECIES: DUF3563 family protein [Caballeronia]|uniref:DUF3563 family protein n=1 Tax=Caballeronia TaxID=1827195 RepID=UPI0002387EB7|nr:MULTISPECIES: DUF3563 family protein [unclassified Caballeronia]AET92110.1 two component transcriptional regulator, winged helix family [Burkholderia sp. YI23]AQH00598.1 transcriptional regulator [Burkholderia sp. KK1]BAO88120.1 two component transcriptional regulator, winged helix family [Burkholderia sp. RPE67]BBP99205.1 hypothetical protein BSFA1_43340 [Burkholderia sp. SFA1]MCE4545525.1 DUF3563 domain-containing protein [Caballeronia sp. PC1]